MTSIKKLLMVITLLLSVASVHAQIKQGQALPDLILQNDNNTNVKLKSFIGKTVLIDYWASWCAPCRVANKKLVKLYLQYKTQNFEIVGISLDTDKAKWVKAIQKDKMTHTQLIDPKGFDAKSAVVFGVEALPAAYLFDASGKLVAINPTEAQIIAQIKKNKK